MGLARSTYYDEPASQPIQEARLIERIKVVSRKLLTDGKYDVQFDNMDSAYEFGIAAFDNAQVRHAMHIGPLQLKFQK